MSDENPGDRTPEYITEDEEVRWMRSKSSMHESLPAGLLEEAHEAFRLFSDAESHMNIRHLYGALRSMGVDATDKDVMTICETHDPDGRGYIDLDEWTVALTRRLAEDGARRERFKARLVAEDSDMTGQVMVTHARTIIETFDSVAIEYIDIEEMLNSLDHAGLIDIDEFMDTMVRPARLEHQLLNYF